MIEPILDISHWQGVFDWPKAQAAGVKAVMVRAGSITRDAGALYKDNQWDRNSVEGPKNLPCGSYWYFRAQYDALAQARFYANLLSGKPMKLPPCLDIESNDTLLSKAVVGQRALAFVTELEKLTGVVPVIYTRKTWWDPNVGITTWAAKYKLWVAHYTLAESPWIPVGWTDYWLWQYSSKGDGLRYGAQSLSIDMNRARESVLPGPTLEERVDAIEKRLAAAGIP